MKINGWPEAEERFHSCPSQREVHQLIGMRGYTLNRAQREKVQMKIIFLSLPLISQKIQIQRTPGLIFPVLIKLLFCLLLQLALQSPALSTQKQEKGWNIFWPMLPCTYIKLKPKDDVQMKVNTDSPVQLFTLFTHLLFMEVDLGCPQPSNCPVM